MPSRLAGRMQIIYSLNTSSLKKPRLVDKSVKVSSKFKLYSAGILPSPSSYGHTCQLALGYIYIVDISY